MQSFPSSFTRNPLADPANMAGKVKKLIGNSQTDTLKNLAKAGLNYTKNAMNKTNSNVITLDKLGENLDFDTDRDYSFNTNVQMYNSSSKFILTTSIVNRNKNIQDKIYTQKITPGESEVYYENAFKMPTTVLESMNNYKYIYSYFTVFDVEKNDSYTTSSTDPTKKGYLTNRYTVPVTPSLFNPWYGVNAVFYNINDTNKDEQLPLNVPITIDGVAINYYPVNSDINENKHNVNQNINSYNSYLSYVTEDLMKTASTQPTKSEDNNGKENKNEKNIDINDCTIKTLVELSKKSPKEHSLGRNTFKYADFMYCKDLGKVSNNHLIVLRKFGTPIGDDINNIQSKDSKGNDDTLDAIIDTGRLITWFGTEDNKLEDICKYDYEMTWKPIEGDIEPKASKEEQDGDKLAQSLANITNPNYVKHYLQGSALGKNKFINYFIGNTPGPYASDQDYFYDDWLQDTNKVYTPRNITNRTHIYEGKLRFNQEITLKFSYKLRYYNGIQPKAAFLDLIGNILEVTYKRGRYWGGDRRIVGPSQNTQAWKTINNITDTFEALISSGGDKAVEELFAGASMKSWLGFIGNSMSSLGDFISGAFNQIAELSPVGKDLKNGDYKEAAKKGVGGVISLLSSNLKNKLGRPQVYAFKTIYDGSPTGLWHLTVGNPRNPILTMGNLILSKAEIQHSGPLGIDDFPTDLSVIVTLKHAQDRDIVSISKMYNKGSDGIYYKLANNLSKFFVTEQTKGTKTENNVKGEQEEIKFYNYNKYNFPEGYEYKDENFFKTSIALDNFQRNI